MSNPTALMAAITAALIAVIFAVKRERAPWWCMTAAFALLSLYSLNVALGTPTLAELTGETK